MGQEYARKERAKGVRMGGCFLMGNRSPDGWETVRFPAKGEAIGPPIQPPAALGAAHVCLFFDDIPLLRGSYLHHHNRQTQQFNES